MFGLIRTLVTLALVVAYLLGSWPVAMVALATGMVAGALAELHHVATYSPTHDEYDQCRECTKCIGHEPGCPNMGT